MQINLRQLKPVASKELAHYSFAYSSNWIAAGLRLHPGLVGLLNLFRMAEVYSLATQCAKLRAKLSLEARVNDCLEKEIHWADESARLKRRSKFIVRAKAIYLSYTYYLTTSRIFVFQLHVFKHRNIRKFQTRRIYPLTLQNAEAEGCEKRNTRNNSSNASELRVF